MAEMGRPRARAVRRLACILIRAITALAFVSPALAQDYGFGATTIRIVSSGISRSAPPLIMRYARYGALR
jgi:hypothetical protein